ncbi:hypothetical protein [Nonomuraea sp. B19D2]|uniref:YncE family protein n=1 Tax=Nonomuraea sp. B19D2 TaxID=3159561 RepID=UPI0032DBE9DF
MVPQLPLPPESKLSSKKLLTWFHSLWLHLLVKNELRKVISGSRFLIGSGDYVHPARRLHHGGSSETLVARLTRRLVALGGALVMAAGLGIAVASAASADDSTTYLGDFPGGGGDVAVGGGKVFIAARERIIVADTQGTVTGAITGLSRAADLAITPDGTRLYAALSVSNEVAEFDTADLSITRRIDLTSYPCPYNLSLSGDRLWVGYGCGTTTQTGGVVSLDLSVTAPQPVQIETGTMLDAPLVVAAGNTLVIGDPGRSAVDLMVYDTSATPATLRGVISGQTYGLSRLRDLAITSDGSMVVPAVSSPYKFDGWDTTSLTRVRTYGAEPTFPGYPAAVAISPDGAQVVGGWVSSRESVDIALYDIETTAKNYAYGNPAGDLVAGSLTFSDADVFGLLWDPYTDRLHLWRLHGGTLPASGMTLTAPSAGTAFEPLTMSGQLTLPDGSAPGTQPLVVTRRLPDGTSAKLPGTTTAEDGTFTITDHPPVSGAIGYDVLWDGDSDVRWSRKSATVNVAKHQSSLTLSGPAEGVAGKQLQFSGTLDTGAQTSPPGASLTVQRTFSNRKETLITTLPAVTPAGDGSFSFTDTPAQGGQYTYTIQWAGDAASLAARADHEVAVQGGLG